MRIAETNKLFAWLMCLFPHWSPTKGTAQVWAQELPDISFELARNAVIKIQEKNPTNFPPSVFEIISCFKTKQSRFSPQEVFACFWNNLSDPQIVGDKNAIRAFRLATGGQGYGQALTDEKAWHERRFIEIYKGIVERHEASKSSLKLPTMTDSKKQLSDKKSEVV